MTARYPDPHARIDGPTTAVNRSLTSAKRRLARLLGLASARLLTPSALEFPEVRRAFWRHGVAAQSKGFYSSLVDPDDLVPSADAQECRGLDLNPAGHHHYLTQVFPRYRGEYVRLPVERPHDWGARPQFFRRNDAFQNLDALVYWSMIRAHRPARIVEIGSGFSTLLAMRAVQENGIGLVTAIDPYPREFIRRCEGQMTLIAAPAEHVALEVLRSLEPDDIVFVDSSHVVRQNGDVTWFFLKALPALRSGVLVHLHDIHLPFDYPIDLVRQRNVYWTEQYLLHAYLLHNTTDEVLFGSRYAAHLFPAETGAAFPGVDKLDGASFWLRIHGAADAG